VPALSVATPTATARLLPSAPWLRTLLWLTAAATVVAGCRRAFGSDARELASSLQDDSFYYLLPAYRAWTHGGLLTFDGEHPMFGVQPAFAALLTLLAGPCPDRETFLRVAYATGFFLHALVGLLLPWCLERRGDTAEQSPPTPIGTLAGLAWCLNLPVLFGFTTLKENGLSALLLTLTLGCMNRVARPGDGTGWQYTRIGVLLGVGLAARLTPGALALAAAIGWLCLRHAGDRLRRAGCIFTGGVLGLLPFAAWGLAIAGRVLPTSGTVKTAPLRAALADGTFWRDLPEYLSQVPVYVLASLQYAVGLPHHYFFVPQTPPPPHHAGWLLAPLAILGLLLLCRRPRETTLTARHLLLLLAAAVLGDAAAPVLLGPFGSVRYFQWYVVAPPLLLAMAAGCSAHALGYRASVWLCIAITGAATLQVLWRVQPAPSFRGDADSWTRQMITIAETGNRLLPANARVAAANAGALGYWSRPDITVVNVDGLANDDWLAATQRGESMRSYLDRNRIQFVCDVFGRDGWHGNVLDGVEPIEVEAYRGPDYDGYFLLERTAARCPDFWPSAGIATASATTPVRCVPWLEGDPLGATGSPSPLRTLASGRVGSWANFRYGAGNSSSDVVAFYPGGMASRFTAVAGGARGALRIEGDGRLLLRCTTTATSWTPIDLDVRDVASLMIYREGADDAVLWLAAVRWLWLPPGSTTAATSATTTAAPFGHGCTAAAGTTPMLSLPGRSKAGTVVTFELRGEPGASGLLWLGNKPAATRLAAATGPRPCYGWVATDGLLVSLPIVVGPDGKTEIAVPLPRELPAGAHFAQALLGLGSPRPTLSNGLRLVVQTAD
jgi:hypothetical protein